MTSQDKCLQGKCRAIFMVSLSLFDDDDDPLTPESL